VYVSEALAQEKAKDMTHRSLAALWLARLDGGGSAKSVLYKEGRGPWRDMTLAEYGKLVEELAFGLASLGLAQGERAAILSRTSYLWVAADLAILSCGGVSGPIYPTSSNHDIEHILAHSEAPLLFDHDEALLRKVLTSTKTREALKKIVLLAPPAKGKSLVDLVAELELSEGLVIGLEELQEAGRVLKAAEPELINQRIAKLNPDDLATIIYTSGTTGTPKGVRLLNSTIMSVVEAAVPIVEPTEADIYLSCLPLSHVFERVCGEFLWLASKHVMAFGEGIEHLGRNIAEIQPTVLLVVPRLLDKMRGKVMSGLEKASPSARALANWGIEVGRQMFACRSRGVAPPVVLKLKHWLAERIVLQQLRAKIGTRLRLIVAGGAPATASVVEFFNAIGIATVEGYGLTETAAPATANLPGHNTIGTVGTALSSVHVKIAEDGEILLSGPSIAPGYFNASAETAEAFTDGWFHTGDIGTLDANGNLKITDRKKDLIVNSSGKNISPQKIEALLSTVPFVNQAVVFGDKKKTLVALLTLEQSAVCAHARQAGWKFNEYADLINTNELKHYLKDEINKRSAELADYEQIRNFAVLPGNLSVEEGELTAVMKVKRNVLLRKYGDLIESLHKD
jgi:long-chain acyl-CoA synthetase